MAGVPNNHNGDIVPIITMSNILFLSQKVNKLTDSISLAEIEIVNEKTK